MDTSPKETDIKPVLNEKKPFNMHERAVQIEASIHLSSRLSRSKKKQ